jgi:hypothetical protein|tara:strand:- start:1073 stop:1720 length:648 start_codon:yes stop_codon:yes gene_type:complete
MKNKIWFFGDCFTWGWGCYPEQPYYEYKKEGDEIWTTLVSNHFKMDEEKPWYGSGALPWIVNLYIDNMDKMKSGDFVVISDTLPHGVLSYNKGRDKVSSYQSFNFDDYDSWIKEEDKTNTLPYITHYINGKEEKWVDYYNNHISKIANELLNRNIKTFQWSHHLWKYEEKFETITQATENNIIDPHFSWLGHKDMSEYIIDLITKDKHIGKKSLF